MKTNLDRRNFIKKTTTFLGLALVSKGLFSSLFTSVAEAEELKLLDSKDTLATTMKYIENAKKNKEAKGKCESCQLFVKQDKKVNGKVVGSCAIFQGKLVLAEGYCNSYVKKG